jgi:uncharacterized protein YndB with AHSA1/START domain
MSPDHRLRARIRPALIGYPIVMFTVTRQVDAPPERVWAVLENGWTYPSWVVGASRMRAVDAQWPAPGSKLHHSAGVWPAVVNDETLVLECDPGRRLRLQAKGWPAGEATVEVRLEPQGSGTLVTMTEDVTRGPSKLVPQFIRQPAIGLRNTETVRRLAYIAEGRSNPSDGSGPDAGSRGSLHQSRIKGGGTSSDL